MTSQPDILATTGRSELPSAHRRQLEVPHRRAGHAILACARRSCISLVIAATASCIQCWEPEPHVLEGLYVVDMAIRDQRPYREVLALLEQAKTMRGAEQAAYGLAQTRFTLALVYDAPPAEVEAALREYLGLDDDPVSRARTAGAAYATHRAFKPYFDAAVADLEAAPRTPVIERALEAAARVVPPREDCALHRQKCLETRPETEPGRGAVSSRCNECWKRCRGHNRWPDQLPDRNECRWWRHR